MYLRSTILEVKWNFEVFETETSSFQRKSCFEIFNMQKENVAVADHSVDKIKFWNIFNPFDI